MTFIFSLYRQIWLNLLVDHCHFVSITKLRKKKPHWLQTQCHPVSAFEENLSTLYWKAAMSMQYVMYMWWYRGEGPESRTFPSPTTCLFSSTAKISRRSNGHDYIVVRKLLPLVRHALQKQIVIPGVWVEEPTIWDSVYVLELLFVYF